MASLAHELWRESTTRQAYQKESKTMLDLSDKQIAQYFRQSFAKADGLWFMQVEERYGLDAALAIDAEVWKIIPKIQARLIKSLGEIGQGLDALYECLTTKLLIEGYAFKTERLPDDGGFRVMISECPWRHLLFESGREHLAERIGRTICGNEYAIWASEFANNIHFELESIMCARADCCKLYFYRQT